MYSRRLFLAALVILGAGARVVGTPTFYAIFEDRSVLGRFDPTTGVWADIGIVHESLRSGPRRVENLEAMTYNWHTGQVLAVASPSGNKPANLYSIDPDTAEALLIGSVGYSGIRGLSYDPVTGMLPASRKCRGNRSELLTIDPDTGVGSSLGTVDLGHVYGLARDPLTGTLYGSAANRKTLVTIDSDTLSYAEFDGHGYSGVEALAFDDSDRLFGVDGSGRVLEFDTADGSAVALSDQSAVGDVGALAFVFTGPVPEPATLLVFLLGSLLILSRKRWTTP